MGLTSLSNPFGRIGRVLPLLARSPNARSVTQHLMWMLQGVSRTHLCTVVSSGKKPSAPCWVLDECL